jgi:hypothetical protein
VSLTTHSADEDEDEDEAGMEAHLRSATKEGLGGDALGACSRLGLLRKRHLVVRCITAHRHKLSYLFLFHFRN